MCGLTGIMSRSEYPGDLADRVVAMTGTLKHRGPDDDGIWCDAESGIGLGFRRLAIIDLSMEGHQPMASASGRFVMVFNGEVYNHPEIRTKLTAEGANFRGHSDTEVMLAAFELWGVREAVRRFVGMFAIAVWDRSLRELSLIRDRLGIKPLYYQLGSDGILFASEIKAMAADPSFDRRLDPDALTDYLRYLYVPAPASIYMATRKLAPGHILTVPLALSAPTPPKPYWALEDVARAGLAEGFAGGEIEATEELELLLLDAVRMRMQSDVPLGALLSGGIDSSLVVGLMQAQSGTPVRTYTIGFDVDAFDEANQAREVARHLGTAHTELYLGGQDALDIIPLLPDMFDEPHADPSQLPTYLVSRLARQDVTVALSGDGGDELFAGYNRYVQGEWVIPRTARWPRFGRRVASAVLRHAPYGLLGSLGSVVGRASGSATDRRLVAGKLRKMGHLLGQDSPADMYRSLLSACQDPGQLLREPRRGAHSFSPEWKDFDLLDTMMLNDQMSYLPDDLLAKVDRTSMAVSLEVRVPLLDHRVVELAWRLSRALKIRDGVGKHILRRVLDRYVPSTLVDRPKMGFSVPVASWLRGPLRGWATELLEEQRMAGDGLFHTSQVKASWQRFKRGDDSEASGLWAVLMFQAWRQRWLPAGPVDIALPGEAA